MSPQFIELESSLIKGILDFEKRVRDGAYTLGGR